MPITQGSGYYTIYLSQFSCFVFLRRLIVGLPPVIFHECFSYHGRYRNIFFCFTYHDYCRVVHSSRHFKFVLQSRVRANRHFTLQGETPLIKNKLTILCIARNYTYLRHVSRHQSDGRVYINLELSRRVFLSVFFGNVL